MPGIQRVLVGLDEAQLADSAVITAIHLSRRLEVPLEVVHAIRTRADHPWFADDETLASLEDELLGEVRKERAKHLAQLLRPLATSSREIGEMLHVALGRPATVLVSRVAEYDEPLQVMGGHRHRGLLDFGGTARHMLHHLPCPMWVQDARPWQEVDSILVPVDLSAGSTSVLRLARRLANALGARLSVLHCFEPLTYSYGAEPALEAVIEDLRVRQRSAFDAFLAEHADQVGSASVEFVDGNPSEEVAKRQGDHQLIVMGTHEHSAVGRAFLGSHAYRVLRESERPVVIVPQPEV